MENGTKALLIAGAVLIAIILVAAGIRIISSINSTTNDSQNIGKSISRVTGDSVLNLEGYAVFRNSDRTVDNPSNKYYKEYSTGIPLKFNYKYTISFDYEVLENKDNVKLGCGVGFNNPEIGKTTYNKDIIWCKDYSNYSEGAKGKFEFTFRLNDYPSAAEYYRSHIDKGEIYISLRPARSRAPSDFAVSVSNIRIIYK